MSKATAAGTGPYTISAVGTVSLAATDKFLGVQYQVLQLDGDKVTYVGFTNLPAGPPVPGKPAVALNGSSPPFPKTGMYRVFFTMQYIDKDGKMQTISAVSKDLTIS